MKPSAPSDGALSEDRFSFSFYPADLRAVEDVIAGLGQKNIKVDRTKVVRGLLHVTPEVDLFAYAVVQFRADEAKPGARENDLIAERFTIVLPVADMKKLDRVVGQLQAKAIKMNDSYVLRSLLRALPPVETLAPVFAKYLADFPDGRTRSARARKHA
jgi:hypothetical protein